MVRDELNLKSTAVADIYQIKVKGILDQGWAESLPGADGSVKVEITDCQACIITAAVIDQAALRGFVTRMWDLNVEIISINKLENTQK